MAKTGMQITGGMMANRIITVPRMLTQICFPTGSAGAFCPPAIFVMPMPQATAAAASTMRMITRILFFLYS